MNKMDIEFRCRNKANELLEKYFPDFVVSAASGKTEVLKPEYCDTLPRHIADEFLEWLEQQWNNEVSAGGKPFAEVMNLKRSMEVIHIDYEDILPAARDEAVKRTLWERITLSNHEDVTYYVGLLKQYSEELLKTMIADFIKDYNESVK